MPISLLWVDDDPHYIRQCIEAVEEELGWTVLNAVDGETAIAELSGRTQWNVVVLDFRLPLGDPDTPGLAPDIVPERVGLAVLRYLREHHPTLPVIVLSGIADWPIFPDLVREAEELTVERVLEKPQRLDELLELLQEVASRSQTPQPQSGSADEEALP
jgi:CheY-like chemotaxis protein